MASPATSQAQTHVAIDAPAPGSVLLQPFAISGWALDLGSYANSGVDAVAVYTTGPIGTAVLLGYATRESRPDVAAHFGRPGFVDAGYRFTINGLPPGSYQFGVMAHSVITNAWAGPYITSAVIPAAPVVVIDPQTTGLQPFVLSGLAGDPLSSSGPGISDVHIHAEPIGGGTPFLIGAARTGLYRPDAAALYGPHYLYSGWDFPVRGLPPGQYTLRAYARSAITGLWGNAVTPAGQILNNVKLLVDTPTVNALVAQPFSIVGATADLAAASGTGASAVHIYAQRVSTGEYIWLGAATPNMPRPDLGPYVGGNPQFANIGFRLDNVGGLSADVYDLVVFVWSTVSNQWNGFATRMRVDLRAAPPHLSPPPGEYSTPITVSITSSTPGAQIRFTIDGSEPTASSPLLPSSVLLSAAGAAKLRAFAPDMFPSATVDASYTFRAATPTLSPPPGVYEGPITVVPSTPTPGTVLRYTTDGSEPQESSPEIAGPVVVSSSLNARIRAFRSGWLPSATVGGLYTIRPAVPTFSIGSGTYSVLQTVVMQTATAGGLIRYTTDGSDPTPASALYTAPVPVPVATTIKGRTFDAAGGFSSVATLVIQYQTATPVLSPPPGAYVNAPLSVFIQTATTNATLRYTLDGSEPGPGSPTLPAGGSVPLDRSLMLKVQAVVQGWPASPIVAGFYEFRVPDPAVQPTSGTYARPFTVTATVSMPGTVLRYTLDGSQPSPASPVWTTFTNPPNGTYLLAVRGFVDGWTASNTVTRQYVITDVVTAAPTISPQPGVHDVGVTVTVTPSESSVVRVTTDESDPTESSPIYSGPIVLTAPTTVKARAFRPNVAPSNVVGGEYRLRLAPPAVSPETGNYGSPPVPTVTHPTSGITLRYTTNRNEPTESSAVWSCCVSMPDNTTFKVRAFKPGWEPSATVTNTYTVGSQTLPLSNAVLTLMSPASEVAQVSESLHIAVSGTPIVASSVSLMRNGVDVTSSAQISSFGITMPSFVVPGENIIEVSGMDAGGAPIGGTAYVYGGVTQLIVRVRSRSGANLSGARVDVFDNAQAFPAQTVMTDMTGTATARVPGGFVGTIAAFAAGYHSAVLASASGTVTVTLSPINGSFERGTQDWGLSWPHETVVRSHIEGISPWICRLNCAASAASTPGSAWGSPSAVAGDMDLLVGSWGSPVGVTVDRTIRVDPGTRSLTVRYRFFSHAQGGSYRLTLSALGTGVTTEHSTTAAALQAQGLATPGVREIQSTWLTLTMALPVGAEEVRINGALPPDVNPGFTGTWLEIDNVSVQGLSMSPAVLNDQHPAGSSRMERLRYLSVGPKDPNSGLTQVWGVLQFSGTAPKRISAVFLDVRSQANGPVRVSVPLRADAGASILNQMFPAGAGGTLTTGASRELFTFNAQQMNVFSATGEEKLFLSVRALDENGAAIPVVGGASMEVQKFTDIPQGASRYGDRDPLDCDTDPGSKRVWPCYGDAWARPTVHQIWRTAQQALAVAVPGGRPAMTIQANDFSNMNGGFFPDHRFHDHGRHIDGWVQGYQHKDAALARRMVQIATEIRTAMQASGNVFSAFQIVVAFDDTDPNDAMTSELSTLQIGGAPALSIIRGDVRNNSRSVHRGHFHVQFR